MGLTKLYNIVNSLVWPKFQEVPLGSGAAINCLSSTLTTWKLNGRTLVINNRVLDPSYQLSSNGLLITNVGRNHNGTYTCLGSFLNRSNYILHSRLLVKGKKFNHLRCGPLNLIY